MDREVICAGSRFEVRAMTLRCLRDRGIMRKVVYYSVWLERRQYRSMPVHFELFGPVTWKSMTIHDFFPVGSCMHISTRMYAARRLSKVVRLVSCCENAHT